MRCNVGNCLLDERERRDLVKAEMVDAVSFKDSDI